MFTKVVIGKKAPDFKGLAVMPDGSFKEISLEDYKGKSVVLFFYPLDFTFVCPSEILAFNKEIEHFHERGAEVIGCSVDSQFSHKAWIETGLEKGGIGKLKFPLLSDLTKVITYDYGVCFEEMGVSFRGLFILDKEHVVRHSTINDLPIGRSVKEVLRVLDAIQFHQTHGDVCPANWKKGKKAMKPSAEGVAEYLTEHFKH